MSALRPLAATLEGALAAPVTAPGYLVCIEVTSVSPPQYIYLSSRGDVPWGGEVWLGCNLDVSGLNATGTGESTALLRVGNTDNLLSALILGPGLAGCPVRVWVFYGDAPAQGDAAPVFSGMADDAGVNLDRVEIKLVGDRMNNLALPRGRMTPAAGFNRLTPDNTVLTWGNARITLKRER